MSEREAWLAVALMGLLAGAVGIYFGYFAWPAAVALLIFAIMSTRRIAAAAAGGITGLAVGSGAILIVGSQCPPNTVCRADFPIESYGAFLAVAAALGAVLTAVTVSRSRSA